MHATLNCSAASGGFYFVLLHLCVWLLLRPWHESLHTGRMWALDRSSIFVQVHTYHACKRSQWRSSHVAQIDA